MNIIYPQSQAHNHHNILNTLEIITNNTNKTLFYNIDNDNTDESFEHRKPTINKRLYHIHISLDQVKKK